MALTKNYSDADTGTSSPEAYAAVTHERIKYREKTAEFTIGVFHNRTMHDSGSAKPIKEIQVSFADDRRFGLDGGLAGRAAQHENNPIKMAAAAGIETHRKVSKKNDKDEITEEVVEVPGWADNLVTWKSAHPTFTDLFGDGTDPDRRSTLERFLTAYDPFFKDWKNA